MPVVSNILENLIKLNSWQSETYRSLGKNYLRIKYGSGPMLRSLSTHSSPHSPINSLHTGAFFSLSNSENFGSGVP